MVDPHARSRAKGGVDVASPSTDRLTVLRDRLREALDRGELRAAKELLADYQRLLKESSRAARRDRLDRRAEHRAQRRAWPKCGAPRADGRPCEARSLWLTGEPSPRTRCRHHGGAQSPNVPRIRPPVAPK